MKNTEIKNMGLLSSWNVGGLRTNSPKRSFCMCGHVSAKDIESCPDCGNTHFQLVKAGENYFPDKMMYYVKANEFKIVFEAVQFVQDATTNEFSLLALEESSLVFKLQPTGEVMLTENNGSAHNCYNKSARILSRIQYNNYHRFEMWDGSAAKYLTDNINTLPKWLKNVVEFYVEHKASAMLAPLSLDYYGYRGETNNGWLSIEAFQELANPNSDLNRFINSLKKNNYSEKESGIMLSKAITRSGYSYYHTRKTVLNILSNNVDDFLMKKGIPSFLYPYLHTDILEEILSNNSGYSRLEKVFKNKGIKNVILYYFDSGLIDFKMLVSVENLNETLIKNHNAVLHNFIRKYSMSINSYEIINDIYNMLVKYGIPITTENLDLKAFNNLLNTKRVKKNWTTYENADFDKFFEEINDDAVQAFINLSNVKRTRKKATP